MGGKEEELGGLLYREEKKRKKRKGSHLGPGHGGGFTASVA